MLVMTDFVPGLKLSRLFYEDVVRPILDEEFPDLTHSAALLGHGSEVLGLDDPQSTDHHWGPRLQLFLNEQDYRQFGSNVGEVLGDRLPISFMGYSTNFGEPDEEGVQLLKEVLTGPVNHRVEICTVKLFFNNILQFNPYNEITVADWLVFPQQELLGITAGEVFFDGLNELNSLRQKFAYYPKDVWLYLLSAQWMKIAQEEAFVGRCGDIGDELGSQIIAARLVRELMKLCFILEKTYTPYSKWLGTAFARLQCSKELIPVFKRILLSGTWKEREARLSNAYEIVGALHNSLGVTKYVEARVSRYHERPYLVINAKRFAEASRNAIEDENIRAISVNVGSVDQVIDSADALTDTKLLRRLRSIFK
jgi:hypothetical protein